mmetsp:Transcript_1104/g.2164  ORF Transcript_1104/g.2164 Transcript_1104/m.2164 type:complete len:290 (-) Transcript_1104:27-896(-)
MAPCPITSIIVLGSNPTDSDSASPSPKAASIVPISELTTNLARVPAPTSAPKKWLALPMAVSPLSLTSLNSSSDPAHKKIKEPMAAGPFEPDTGASKNRPPFSTTAAFIRCISASANVAQSTIDFPDETPANTPLSPSKTILLASGVDSILYVLSHASTTSRAVSLMIIFLSGNFSLNAVHLLPVRFQITKALSSLVPAIPSDSNRPAMPSPMIPNPTNPIGAIFRVVLVESAREDTVERIDLVHTTKVCAVAHDFVVVAEEKASTVSRVTPSSAVTATNGQRGQSINL